MQRVGDPPSFHCAACGREVPLKRRMGRRYAVCSPECVREMEWRDACNTLGKPYTLSPEAAARARELLELLAEEPQ